MTYRTRSCCSASFCGNHSTISISGSICGWGDGRICSRISRYSGSICICGRCCWIGWCCIFGGNGFSQEYDIERFYRDAMLLIIGEGTNEMQRIIIARQWTKRHPI